MRCRIFKIPEPITGKTIVYIPAVWKLYLVESHVKIPDFIEIKTSPPPAGPKPAQPGKFLGVQFTINQICNLSCKYCYADARPAGSRLGPFNIIGQGPRVMPWKIAKAAINRVIKDTLNCNQKKIEIILAGGEPTLSMELIKKIVYYSRTECVKNCLQANIGIVSNGVFNKKTREWLVDNLDYITISIDGTKEIHNLQRPSISGKDVYSLILHNIRSIHKSGKVILGLRMTVTSLNVNLLPELILYLHEQFPGRRIGFEPVQNCGRCSTNELNDPAKNTPTEEELVDSYLKVFATAKKFGINLKSSIASFKSPESNMSFCGVDGQNFCIDPEGYVSACTRVTSQHDPMSKYFYFGKYNPETDDFDINQEQYDYLRKMNVKHYQQCHNCFAQYNCKGDCPHIKADLGNDFFNKTSPRCKMIRNLTLGLFQLQLGIRK